MANNLLLGTSTISILKRDIQGSFNEDEFKDKINCAINSIKKELSENVEPFLLISGDLSGIQETVYTISPKGALKSLRARSFMLELLCEHCCYELITTSFGNYIKFQNHIIFSGGGGFCLLLPNKEDVRNNIKLFKEIINNWAFKEFGGKLYVAISHISLSEDELNNNFGTNWETLTKKLEIDKKQKFNWNLRDIFPPKINDEPFQKNNSQECQICHRDDIDLNRHIMYALSSNFEATSKIVIHNDIELKNVADDPTKIIFHDLCYNLLLIGTKLKDAENIFRYHDKPISEAFITLPSLPNDKVKSNLAYYSLNEEPNLIHIWSINVFNKFNNDNSTLFLFANYVFPTGSVDFESLANASCGAKLIGCLRMDVDDLGKSISQNLIPFNLASLSRLSFKLNYFFKVELMNVCHSSKSAITNKDFSKGRNVSIIYSGGDDLLIVGAWDEVAELSINIKKRFDDFFKEYSNLTISAGLTLHKHNYPFYLIAKQSKAALSYAKNDDSHKKDHPKNRVALFYSPKRFLSRKYLIEASGRTSNYNEDIIRLSYLWADIDEFIFPFLKVFTDNGTYDTNNKLVLNKINPIFIHKLFSITKKWETSKEIYLPTLINLLSEIREKTSAPNYFTMNSLFQLANSNNIKTMHAALTWLSYLMR